MIDYVFKTYCYSVRRQNLSTLLLSASPSLEGRQVFCIYFYFLALLLYDSVNSPVTLLLTLGLTLCPVDLPLHYDFKQYQKFDMQSNVPVYMLFK